VVSGARDRTLLAAALAALGLSACLSPGSDGAREFYDPGAGGKADVFGRELAGVPSDYQASSLDEGLLTSDMRARREAAWETVVKVLDDVPLLGLAGSAEEHPEIMLPNGEVPRVPRFETWYGIDDIKRMFQHLYEALPPSQRAVRAPFDDQALEEAANWNATALERMSSWPLERYLKYVRQLGLCPSGLSDEECVAYVQQSFSGAVSGTARILYSPATVDRALRSYGRVLDCLTRLDQVGLAQEPAEADNFSLCFDRELAPNSVLVKAQWMRADFGRKVPTFDTDAQTIAQRLGGVAHWGDEGDRQQDPSPAEIFTIRLRNGDTYRLVGLHIMTKELRHWQWISLWWSDQPDVDFGADRPPLVRDQLEPVWKNYKMCVVAQYDERDADAAGRYPEAPTLSAVLQAIDGGVGGPTWCSNPYIEHGRHNARTNCIGCHQHGGSTVTVDKNGDGTLDPLDLEAIINDETNFPDTGRRRVRNLFPADYLYSFNRVDDWANLIANEVSFFDDADKAMVRPRVQNVLRLTGDSAQGGATFAERCSRCHGEDGRGSSFAPSLYERVPMRDDESIVQTLILGRGQMPSWGGTFSDQQLADILAFLRMTFGGGS
jgi:mono/diheme cytochrome c family protein